MSRDTDLEDVSFGACHRSVIVVRGKSRREIRKEVKLRNWKIEGENPGGVYASDCKALRVLRTDGGLWEAICLRNVYWDV